jgi:DNA-binding MarR family transcriptional regulator
VLPYDTMAGFAVTAVVRLSRVSATVRSFVPQDRRVSEERELLVAELVRETRVLARQLVRYYDAVADQLGLHATDLACLGSLRDKRRATAGELATELGLTTGAVTRMIDRLHKGGFVQRLRDPGDGRRVIVALRPEAEREVVGLFAGQAAQITESSAALTGAQLRFLLDFVRERTDVARGEADRLRRIGKAHATRRTRSQPVT